MSECVCQRCRRVCFSQQQLENHPCFDMAAKIEDEIRAATGTVNVPFDSFMAEYREKQGVSKEVSHEAVTPKEGAAQSASVPSQVSAEAVILAASMLLFSRALAHLGASESKHARTLSVDIVDHLDAIKCYVFAHDLGWEIAEAQGALLATEQGTA